METDYQEKIDLPVFQIEELEERLEMAKWYAGVSTEQGTKTGTKAYASVGMYF